VGLTIVAVVAGLTGFGTGLLAFRVKNRWCPVCGATTLTLTV
jgi:NADH pyrophosphatase NudC (nudix superfamily)